MSNQEEALVDAAAGAKHAGMSAWWLRKHSKNGEIPSYLVSANRRRWKLSEISNYLATRKSEVK